MGAEESALPRAGPEPSLRAHVRGHVHLLWAPPGGPTRVNALGTVGMGPVSLKPPCQCGGVSVTKRHRWAPYTPQTLFSVLHPEAQAPGAAGPVPPRPLALPRGRRPPRVLTWWPVSSSLLIRAQSFRSGSTLVTSFELTYIFKGLTSVSEQCHLSRHWRSGHMDLGGHKSAHPRPLAMWFTPCGFILQPDTRPLMTR